MTRENILKFVGTVFTSIVIALISSFWTTHSCGSLETELCSGFPLIYRYGFPGDIKVVSSALLFDILTAVGIALIIVYLLIPKVVKRKKSQDD